MTPPPKKTSRPATSAAKRGAAKKPAPKRKKTRRKSSGWSLTALAAAVAVGIALTLSALWIVNRLGEPEPRSHTAASGGAQKRPALSEKASGKREEAAKSSPALPGDRRPVGGAKPGASDERNDRPLADQGRDAQRAAPEGAVSGPAARSPALPPGTDGSAAAEGAVASALIDLKALPYEESLNASLDERIRQVDYALMQAAWLRKIPAAGLRLVSVEDRLEGVEPYQFQIIDILPGKKAREYTDALKSCLAAWAEGAVLNEQSDNRWLIVVNGVETHHIRLFPGSREFPPLPGHSGQSPPAQTASVPYPAGIPSGSALPGRSGLERPSLRAPGEPARMVIVMDDLGASHAAVQQLLALDYPVTFAFWPHGEHTTADARAAHRAGREILIHQPMEPLGYPRVRPGPNPLLVGMPADRIQAILEESIAVVPHAVGLNNHMGSRFTQHAAGVDVVAATLKRHGFFALDSLTHNRSVFAAEARRYGLATYQRNVFLDVTASRSKILDELQRAEHIALLTGQSIAIGHPLPETLAALKEWQRLRNKEVRLVRLQDLGR